MTDDIAQIKEMLALRIIDLMSQLRIEGHRAGRFFIGKNPTRSDKHGGSFWVALNSGVWKDEATGDGGDVLKLIEYIQGSDFKTAIKWARDYLGLTNMAPAEIKMRKRVLTAGAEAREKHRAQELAKDRKRAMALYIEAKKRKICGSPADIYLRSRGIDLRHLGKLPGALGWLAESWHSETKQKYPALLACMTGDDGAVMAVHRTFLRPDGSDKIDAKPCRKIWPTYKGAAVRLWRGSSDLSIKDAASQGLREKLVLTEGVEDALSVALAAPALRIWAAGSLANLREIKVPECVDQVVICADNDWGKPQAQALLRKGVNALAAQGVSVDIAKSHIGKDMNDALQGGG